MLTVEDNWMILVICGRRCCIVNAAMRHLQLPSGPVGAKQYLVKTPYHDLYTLVESKALVWAFSPGSTLELGLKAFRRCGPKWVL
jgi:hypothetical protein